MFWKQHGNTAVVMTETCKNINPHSRPDVSFTLLVEDQKKVAFENWPRSTRAFRFQFFMIYTNIYNPLFIYWRVLNIIYIEDIRQLEKRPSLFINNIAISYCNSKKKILESTVTDDFICNRLFIQCAHLPHFTIVFVLWMYCNTVITLTSC